MLYGWQFANKQTIYYFGRFIVSMQHFLICPYVSSVYHPSFSGFLVSSIFVSSNSISFVSCIPPSPLFPLYIWSSLSMISSFSGSLSIVPHFQICWFQLPKTNIYWILGPKLYSLVSEKSRMTRENVVVKNSRLRWAIMAVILTMIFVKSAFSPGARLNNAPLFLLIATLRYALDLAS